MSTEELPPRESMEFDAVIVGAGPAGLAAPIRLKQLSPDLTVVVVEKGSEVGAHILSGAVIDPIGLDRLLPDWQADSSCPIKQRVAEDRFYWLSQRRAIRIPSFLFPPLMSTKRNFITSLGNVCRWLGKNGKPKDSFTRGIELRGKYSLFAEGARGSLSKTLIERYALGKDRDPPKFGLGLKELWQVQPDKHHPGLVQHS